MLAVRPMTLIASCDNEDHTMCPLCCTTYNKILRIDIYTMIFYLYRARVGLQLSLQVTVAQLSSDNKLFIATNDTLCYQDILPAQRAVTNITAPKTNNSTVHCLRSCHNPISKLICAQQNQYNIYTNPEVFKEGSSMKLSGVGSFFKVDHEKKTTPTTI